MAEIVHFPRPAPRLIWPPATAQIDSLAAIAAEAHGRQRVAKAIEHLSSASLELSVVNFMSLQSEGDVTDQVSDEVLSGVCYALIAIIDAKGSRNDDLPLRRAAVQAIADREGIYHEG